MEIRGVAWPTTQGPTVAVSAPLRASPPRGAAYKATPPLTAPQSAPSQITRAVLRLPPAFWGGWDG